MIDRTVAPKANPIAAQKLILPEVIPSGKTSIYHFPNNTLPVVRIEFVLGLNSINEDSKGINYFTVKMLQEGSKELSSHDVSDAFSQKGAFLEITPGIKRSSIVVYCLSQHVKELLPLIFELITESVFPEEQLEKLKEQSINALKINRAKNAYLASKTFSSKLFGTDHYYGRQLDESEIASITTEPLKKHYQAFFNNCFIDAFVTGQVDSSDINTIDHFLSGLHANKMLPKKVGIIPQSQFRVVEDIEDSIQSTIKIGKISLSKHDKDYAALFLLNEIFGGYFGSRLMTNLREEKGLTYGIYSRLRGHLECSAFEISADVRKQDRELATNEILKELDNIVNVKVDEEELDKVKQYISGSLLSSFGSIFDHADKFKTVHYQQLPLDYYDKLQDKIFSVSAEKLVEIGQQYLAPSTMNYVTVG